MYKLGTAFADAHVSDSVLLKIEKAVSKFGRIYSGRKPIDISNVGIYSSWNLFEDRTDEINGSNLNMMCLRVGKTVHLCGEFWDS